MIRDYLLIGIAALMIFGCGKSKEKEEEINAMFHQAGMSLISGNHNNAIGMYFKIIEMSPDKNLEARIHNNIGIAYMQLRDMDIAAKAFEKGCGMGSSEACDRMRQLQSYR